MKATIFCLLTNLMLVNVVLAQPNDFVRDVQQHANALVNMETRILDFSKQLQCAMKLSDEDLCHAVQHCFCWEDGCYLIEARRFALCETGSGNVDILTATPLHPSSYLRFYGPLMFKGILILHCDEQAHVIKLITPEPVVVSMDVEETSPGQIVAEQAPAIQQPAPSNSVIPQSPNAGAPLSPNDHLSTEQAMGRVFD